MNYEFLEDIAIADIAFQASGNTLEEVFQVSGDATINAMIENIEEINHKETRNFHIENDELDLLLFNFLQELVYYKDSELLLLRTQEIKIYEEDGQHQLNAVMIGEKLDRDRHEQRVDVKAVTLHRFKLEKTAEGWTALVILDI
ncbi:MAG TPA: archease [Oculatellaceae cyanobacterium]|jgi:SHS2 domain-containing protein